MTKRVYITVRGEHTVDGVAQDPVEVRTEGKYYCRGGRHYLLYDELMEGGSSADPPSGYSSAAEEDGTDFLGGDVHTEPLPFETAGRRGSAAGTAGQGNPERRIRSLVKFNAQGLEISRTGGVESHMHFEKDRMHMTQYRTPSGILELGVEASSIRLTENAHRIEIQVDYTLYAGGSKVQDSRVCVTVIPYPIV